MSSFIVNGTSGDLAKWLRILGKDTEFIQDMPDMSLIAKALKENRLIVTRSSKLKETDEDICVHIPFTNPISAIQSMKERGLLNDIKPFLRCIECNEKLLNISKNSVLGRVPPYIWKTKSEFKFCPSCGRIFWKGSHLRRMVNTLRDAKIIDNYTDNIINI